MIMSKIKLVLVLFGLLAAGLGIAQQTTTMAGDDTDMSRTLEQVRAAREGILREEIRFSNEEAAVFWPVYEQYQAELQVVRDRFAELLSNYAKAYRAGEVSEAHANKLIDDYLGIQSEVIDIKKDYLDDFRRVLPARKAARFYQIENKIEIELEYQLSLVIPLIDPV